MMRNMKRFECRQQSALIVSLVLLLTFNTPAFAAKLTPTSQPTSLATKYDPAVADRAKKTINKAIRELKKTGKAITVKVKKVSSTSIAEQINKQLKNFEKRSAAGKATLKDQLRVIDIMRTQCNILIEFIDETKKMNLKQTKKKCIAALMQLSNQLAVKAQQFELKAIANKDPEWQTKMHELAASANRFAYAYARWAEAIRAHPVEAQLKELEQAEEYLLSVKEMLVLIEDYLKMSGDFDKFTAQLETFTKRLDGLHSGIQKFARLVSEVPTKIPVIQQKPEADERSQPKTGGSSKLKDRPQVQPKTGGSSRLKNRPQVSASK